MCPPKDHGVRYNGFFEKWQTKRPAAISAATIFCKSRGGPVCPPEDHGVRYSGSFQRMF